MVTFPYILFIFISSSFNSFCHLSLFPHFSFLLIHNSLVLVSEATVAQVISKFSALTEHECSLPLSKKLTIGLHP
jgi:hypothetical protein